MAEGRPSENSQKANWKGQVGRHCIKDDGLGSQATQNQSKNNGFGTRLVQLLTLQLDGQMEESTKDGVETVIRFKPLEKAA